MTEPAQPEQQPPARPIPDLGFFAGPATGGSQFGAPPVTSQFGAPPVTSQFGTAPATNQFGTAPATNQFGTVPVTNQFGTPLPAGYPTPPQHQTSGGFLAIPRGVWGVVCVVIVLLTAAGFGYSRLMFVQDLFRGDLQAPTSLGGLPRATGPGVQATEQSVVTSLEAENSGDAVAAIYGGGQLSMAAQRVRVDIDREFSDAGAAGQEQRIGENTCAPVGAGTMCLRTSRSLTVMVAGTAGQDQVAAALDEAWDAL